MKKIVIVSHHIGGIGGVQTYNEILGTTFAQKGYAVTIMGLAKVGAELRSKELNDSIQTIAVNQNDIFKNPIHLLRSKLDLKMIRKIEDEIKNAEFVICANPICMLFIKKICKKHHKKVYGFFHSSYEMVYTNQGQKIYRYFLRSYRKIEKMIVLSKEDAEKFSQKRKANNIDYIFNPITKQNPIAEKVNNTFVYCGRFDDNKQVDQAIIAFDKANLKMQQMFNLEIFGYGPTEKKLKYIVDKLDTKDQIKFMGNVSDKSKIYANKYAIILSSKIEGMPMSLLEAMSYNLPIISYESSAAIKQMIEQAKTGFLVDNDDINELYASILKLMQSNELQKTMMHNTHQKAKEYTLDKYSQRIDKVFNLK